MNVLGRYRNNNRKKTEKKNRINIEVINKKDEFSILKLNDNIKELILISYL